jgi:hypothetical protein
MGSFLDAAFKGQTRTLEQWNLSRNPFHKEPPPDDWIDRIFVGRQQEMYRAASAFLGLPRNIIVRGGYGMGKTTFVKKLLRELAATETTRFLVAYQPLVGDRPIDFQHAVLKALAASLRDSHVEACTLYESLFRNERYDHPDLHIRSLIELANQAHDRIVVAIDELEKRPNRVIQEIIVQCRPILDLPCSFVIPSRLLDAMSHVDTSAFGAFMDAIDLEPFDRSGSREILQRTLRLSRLRDEESSPFHPFAEPVVERLIADAQGIPRVIHALGFSLLETTLESVLLAGEQAITIGLDRYEASLLRSGAMAYAGTEQRAREVLLTIYRHGGYIDQLNLAEYFDDDFPLDANLQVVESLTHHDLLVKTESASTVRYALEASVERYLSEERRWKETTLQPLWKEALDPARTPQERGAQLETFAVELFGRVFRVVERNLRTETEELDLVLEFPGGPSNWARTPLILVECKNWSSRVPQQDLSALATKARLDDMSLVFALSVAGFTHDARIQAERIRQHDRLLMVLIDGEDIQSFFGENETADDFLQRLQCRAQLNAQ